MKGSSHNLMKKGAKRRRTKEEIKQEKFEEAKKSRDVEAKLEQFERIERELEDLRESQVEMDAARNAMEALR